MAAFPTDIITKILSRLPVKSLLRFQCVCKSWYSLMKTPHFIKLHLNQTLTSNSDLHLLVLSKNYPLRSSDLSFSELHHPNNLSFSELRHPLNPRTVVKLIGSCNGVVCIFDDKSDVFLYNPLTKSHRKLPANTIPNNKSIVFGFGYDSKNDDYKVLRMVQGFNDEVSYNKARVYSLDKNSWKSVQGIPYYLYHEGIDGVLVNESLHYIVTKELHSQFQFIVNFNLRTETFSLIDPTKDGNKFGGYLVLMLSELGGCLCVVGICPFEQLSLEEVDVWIMKEYGNRESWVRLCTICQPGRIYAQVKPLVYSIDRQRILLEKNSRFGWYDLNSNIFDNCRAHGLPDGWLEKSYYFVGSLLLLEDKPRLEKETLPRKNKIKKNDLDDFLSEGFKLRL